MMLDWCNMCPAVVGLRKPGVFHVIKTAGHALVTSPRAAIDELARLLLG